MADTNDDLLDGELDGDFGELDGEEEDALLADDDYLYQAESRSTQRSVYIEEEEEDKTDSHNNKFYHEDTVDEVQDVAEGDEILEEEEDVLDLGVVDELESELDETPQGSQQQGWRVQEQTDNSMVSEGGPKLNRSNSVSAEKANVTSSTNVNANNVGMESDEDDSEEQSRGRFKSERNTASNIICLKSPLKKTLGDIPDSLDNVVPAGQIHQGNVQRGTFRGPNRGGRGGQQQPLVIVSVDNVSSQRLPGNINNRGMWRHNRGRAVGGFQRPMRPPMQGLPPRHPPMMGPYPMNQGIRPLPPHHPHQQKMNFPHNPKIHINPHFRGGVQQGHNVRPEWDESVHQQGPPGAGPPFPVYSQPVQIQRVFNNQQAPQPPPHDRFVCLGGSRITIQNFPQSPGPGQNFEEFPNKSFNNGQFSGPNNMYPNQQVRPAIQPQMFEEQFPPRGEYQEPLPPQPHQFNTDFQGSEWNQGQPMYNSPTHQQPPPQFYGREQPLHPPSPQQQVFRPPGPMLRPPHQQQQPFQTPPRGQFRGGIRGRLGAQDNRTLNKRIAASNQTSNEIPFKQPRFEQRKGGPVMSNLHEVQTVDNLPPEILPDTTTEPEEEDEETKQYRLKIEEQKKLREKILAEKEARRQQAAEKKKKEELSQKLSQGKTKIDTADEGPSRVEAEPKKQNTVLVSSSPLVSIPLVDKQSVSIRGGLSQAGRGSVHTRIDLKAKEQGAANPVPNLGTTKVVRGGTQPTVTVTSSGICLPTKYKIVRVRTKDGSIQTKKTPVLLDGSQIDTSSSVITRSIQNIPEENMQQGIQRIQKLNTGRGGFIPVRAQGMGRGGVRRGVARGGPMSLRGRGTAPAFRVSTEAPTKPLTVGERFAMHRNQQQIQSSQPQAKSNRVVMPTGLVQVTSAVNTVPIPNSCLLTIDNLSASTTKESIIRMAQQVGKIKHLKLDTKSKRAILRFVEPSSAAMFFQRFQRKMVDLSMINVTVVAE